MEEQAEAEDSANPTVTDPFGIDEAGHNGAKPTSSEAHHREVTQGAEGQHNLSSSYQSTTHFSNVTEHAQEATVETGFNIQDMDVDYGGEAMGDAEGALAEDNQGKPPTSSETPQAPEDQTHQPEAAQDQDQKPAPAAPEQPADTQPQRTGKQQDQDQLCVFSTAQKFQTSE